MTDINEIIGRTLVEQGLSTDDESMTARLSLEIAAAVVKALGEAGYEITQKQETDKDKLKRLIDFMALVEKAPDIGRFINGPALRRKYEEARAEFERNWPGVYG